MSAPQNKNKSTIFHYFVSSFCSHPFFSHASTLRSPAGCPHLSLLARWPSSLAQAPDNLTHWATDWLAHNAPDPHSPAQCTHQPYTLLSLQLSPHPFCPSPRFLSLSFILYVHLISLKLSPSLSRCSDSWILATRWTGGPTTDTISHLIPEQGSMSGTSQSSQSHCRAKQRLCAPSFKPGPLRQLPPPRSHWQTARKTDGLCIHDQFSGSPRVSPIQGRVFVSYSIIKLFSLVEN